MPNQALAQEKITGPQKAAVLLFSLGEDLAAEIVKNLDEDEVRKLGGSMSGSSPWRRRSSTRSFPNSINWRPLLKAWR